MSYVKIACHQCGQHLEVAPALSGTEILRPACSATVTVPVQPAQASRRPIRTIINEVIVPAASVVRSLLSLLRGHIYAPIAYQVRRRNLLIRAGRQVLVSRPPVDGLSQYYSADDALSLEYIGSTPHVVRRPPVMAELGAVRYDCPSCSQTLEAPREMAGVEIECPACHGKIAVPRPAPATTQLTEHRALGVALSAATCLVAALIGLGVWVGRSVTARHQSEPSPRRQTANVSTPTESRPTYETRPAGGVDLLQWALQMQQMQQMQQQEQARQAEQVYMIVCPGCGGRGCFGCDHRGVVRAGSSLQQGAYNPFPVITGR